MGVVEAVPASLLVVALFTGVACGESKGVEAGVVEFDTQADRGTGMGGEVSVPLPENEGIHGINGEGITFSR